MQHMDNLISGNLCMMTAFDLVSFIQLCRSLGINAALSTRKEAARLLDKIGHQRELALWDRRLLILPEKSHVGYMGTAMIGRFLLDLTCPAYYLKARTKREFTRTKRL